MSDPVAVDEGFWERLAQARGPGYASAVRAQMEKEQLGATPAALADKEVVVPPEVVAEVPQAPGTAVPAALARPADSSETPAALPVATTPPPQVEQPIDFTPPGPQTAKTTDERTQITLGQKMDPFTQAQLHTSQLAEVGAIEQRNEAQVEADRKIADAEAKRATEEAALREKQAAAIEERKRLNDEYLGKIQAAQKEVDGDKGPPEETVGESMRNRIALALGAFGATLAGGANHAHQIVEADRAQKINKWKAEHARKQGKVTGAQNLYALYRNKGLDDEAAEALAIKSLNEGYATVIRQIQAQYKAPITLANAEAELEKIRQGNLMQDDRIKRAGENQVTRLVDAKTVTKEGGASIEDQKKLLDSANTDEVKDWKGARRALSRFQDLVRAGADGAAMADFIAGEGGLKQGSFGTSMIEFVDKMGWKAKKIEQLRTIFGDGVRPELVQKIANGLAAQTFTARQRAEPAIRHFQRRFVQAGIDPRLVTGGETASDAAAAVGATPSEHQGAQ
jgi:hypothetical protein